MWNFRRFLVKLRNYEITSKYVWNSNMWNTSLPWGVLRYFHPSPATITHHNSRSGLNPRNELKQQYEREWNRASTQETQGFDTEVRAHNQGIPTSPLMCPQIARSLSTLILPQPTTKIKDGSLTQFAPQAGDTNFPKHPQELSASTSNT